MGLLDPLYWVVSWVLVAWHSFWSLFLPKDSGAAWALAIAGLVLVIRILLIPLFVKQIKAQRALQILQPEIKAIQKRYKDDRQKQSEEMMKLYREHVLGEKPLEGFVHLGAIAPATPVAPKPAAKPEKEVGSFGD